MEPTDIRASWFQPPAVLRRATQLSEEQGMSLGAALQTIERYTANCEAVEFEPVRETMIRIMGY